jgi:hypothetical protein
MSRGQHDNPGDRTHISHRAPADEAEPRAELERYFAVRYGAGVRVAEITPLGGGAGDKGFGYGTPLRVRLDGAPVREVVVRTVRAGGFGHETLADRAAAVVLAYETFNHLPCHVRTLDMGAVRADRTRVSLNGVRDFFLVTEYAEGEPYFRDLERIAATGHVTEADRVRVDRLAGYLAEIHAARVDLSALYVRRIRELFGHHECILGLLDSYDGLHLEGFTSAAQLRGIEHRCVEWRHRLKGCSHRLCRVHGDFHPWNVLWSADDGLALLDRSRGDLGEAADDVSCMAINFLFFSLQAHGRLGGPLEELWHRFFERYLSATHDQEMLRVIPPYFLWRALVLASPLWYPAIDLDVRRLLFGFIHRLLEVEEFDWRRVNTLLEESA